MKSPDENPGLNLSLSIFLLSAAALGYEILLIRLFSISYWHHFAAMIISLALLGYGASGTFLALFRPRLMARFNRVFFFHAFSASLSMVFCFSLVRFIPFNPLELVWDPRQYLYLFAIYLFLSLPFFFIANCIGLSFQCFPEGIPRLYRADLIGAGLGGILVIIFLFMAMPWTCLKFFALMGLTACGVFSLGGNLGLQKGAAPGLILLGLCAVIFWPSGWVKPRLSEYKDLSMTLRVAGARLLYQDSGPLGLLSVVENSRIPFRHAPGLSLYFTGDLPEQLGIFVDGEGPAVIYRTVESISEHAFLDQNLKALPFHLFDHPRVLVLGAGGGGDVLQARYHRAGAIDAVEMDPRVIELVGTRFSGFSGNLYGEKGIRTYAEEARAFLRGREGKYDLIMLSLSGSLGASAGGVHAVSENFLLTVEAFREYYDKLAPGGVLSVTRWLRLPPRESLKLLSTVIEALEDRGVMDPENHIIMARNWDTFGLFFRKGGYHPGEVQAAIEFLKNRGFDRVFDPVIQPGDANQNHLLERPAFYEGAVGLLGPGREKFIEDYKFDIRPARDDRPFFSQFFRWKALPEIIRTLDRGGAPLMEWGYLLLGATVIQAALAGTVIVFLPLLVFLRRRPVPDGGARFGVYFFLLGLSFLFIEIVLLKKFILFLNHPIYASTMVISIFLVAAGTGSGFVTSRYGSFLRTFSHPVLLVAGLLVLWGLIFLAFFPLVLNQLGGLPVFPKILASIVLLFPMGFLMGIPFPLGLLRVQSQAPGFIPWAWGINGLASVMSTVLGAILAVHWGLSFVFILGIGLYAASGIILPSPLKPIE